MQQESQQLPTSPSKAPAYSPTALGRQDWGLGVRESSMAPMPFPMPAAARPCWSCIRDLKQFIMESFLGSASS
ncbi:hypothetical protein CT0861_08371 [Colletotrichum tofieldiae]|uniref:Uncharacterized protein n=1 Tax=Colletotrichum tofieldiae TaxID=708197 RepID=A0A166WXM3_9PEZI|nr:hypothetical protein CT0861_08371 [Colletotrichum tofieldiae]